MVSDIYSLHTNFLTRSVQLETKNLGASIQAAIPDISSSIHTNGNFRQEVASMPLVNPVRVEGNRIRADEKQMQVDKPYIIQYGKGIFIIRKDSKDRVHVFRLP